MFFRHFLFKLKCHPSPTLPTHPFVQFLKSSKIILWVALLCSSDPSLDGSLVHLLLLWPPVCQREPLRSFLSVYLPIVHFCAGLGYGQLGFHIPIVRLHHWEAAGILEVIFLSTPILYKFYCDDLWESFNLKLQHWSLWNHLSKHQQLYIPQYSTLKD